MKQRIIGDFYIFFIIDLPITEVYKWCEENISGVWKEGMAPNGNGGRTICAAIKEKSDAMAFKLRWT